MPAVPLATCAALPGLPSADGPVLVELELSEPSLLLQHGGGEVDPAHPFAMAIAARA